MLPLLDATTGASPRSTNDNRLGDGTALGPQANASTSPSQVLQLPLSLRLHGKFDFSYEHRDWKDQPFQKGRAAFQTYHHFLFLSRVADDPFGINVEFLTQAFYEFSGRIAPKGRNFDVLFKAGKILVPFGNEPLFHRSYGGRSGFDQEIFPVIWAQPGIAGSVHAHAGPIAVLPTTPTWCRDTRCGIRTPCSTFKATSPAWTTSMPRSATVPASAGNR